MSYYKMQSKDCEIKGRILRVIAVVEAEDRQPISQFEAEVAWSDFASEIERKYDDGN